jgi:hypothetical protein
MSFIKTGDAPIAVVYCPCGGQIDPTTKKCTKCGKSPGEATVPTEPAQKNTTHPVGE